MEDGGATAVRASVLGAAVGHHAYWLNALCAAPAFAAVPV